MTALPLTVSSRNATKALAPSVAIERPSVFDPVPNRFSLPPRFCHDPLLRNTSNIGVHFPWRNLPIHFLESNIRRRSDSYKLGKLLGCNYCLYTPPWQNQYHHLTKWPR